MSPCSRQRKHTHPPSHTNMSTVLSPCTLNLHSFIHSPSLVPCTLHYHPILLTHISPRSLTICTELITYASHPSTCQFVIPFLIISTTLPFSFLFSPSADAESVQYCVCVRVVSEAELLLRSDQLITLPYFFLSLFLSFHHFPPSHSLSGSPDEQLSCFTSLFVVLLFSSSLLQREIKTISLTVILME